MKTTTKISKKEDRNHIVDITILKRRQREEIAEKFKTMNFSMDIIKDLQFDIINARAIKRKIANDNNCNWEAYRLAHAEIQRRIINKLDLETGKTFEQLKLENKEKENANINV